LINIDRVESAVRCVVDSTGGEQFPATLACVADAGDPVPSDASFHRRRKDVKQRRSQVCVDATDICVRVNQTSMLIEAG
jgi:hypothetical protein